MGDTKTQHVDPSNLEQSRAWDGDEGEFWAANRKAFDDAVAAYHQSLLAAGAIQPGFRVLDIGCGTGQTTRDAARIATSGRALGVDLSSKMLQVARRLAEEEGLRNVVFEYADADKVLCRRWNWRQDARSAIRSGTRRAIVTLQANGAGDAAAAAEQLIALLRRECGGRYAVTYLGAEKPVAKLAVPD